MAVRRRVEALLLAPGAGASRDHATLTAIEAKVAPMPVARMDFPYRKAGRKAPDRAPVLVQSVVDEAAALAQAAGVDPGRIAMGGRSMGGRMCSMAVAEGLPAAALVLLAYPLHPPGRPDKLRIEHLPQLDLPVLVLSGTKDPFGTPAELEHHFAAVPGPVTFVWIDGVGHEWRRRDDEVAAHVADWLSTVTPPARRRGPRG
jgi:predicted alpha/beta-hydrolase family hydrolase